jgi:hypothetical protein
MKWHHKILKMTWQKETSEEDVISHNNNMSGQKSISNVEHNINTMLKINNVQGFQKKINITLRKSETTLRSTVYFHSSDDSTLGIIKIP